jgi:hypothetical protein
MIIFLSLRSFIYVLTYLLIYLILFFTFFGGGGGASSNRVGLRKQAAEGSICKKK